MGAEFIDFTYPGDKTKREVEEAFAQQQKDDEIYYGNSGYTGSSCEMPEGVNWIPESFPSVREACEYAEQEHEKWEQIFGIQVVADDGTKSWYLGGWASS